MKRFLGVSCFVAILLWLTLPFTSWAQMPETSYVLSADGLTLVRWVGSEKEIDMQSDSKLKRVESIGIAAFANNEEVQKLVMPNSLKKIDQMAFYGCKGLQGKLVIPDKCDRINLYAFYGCSSLEEFSIPKATTTIVGYVFAECPSLKRFYVEEGNPRFTAVDGVLFNQDTTWLYAYPNKKGEEYVVPKTVERIEIAAFYGAYDLSSIELPEGLERIQAKAFAKCKKITQIKLPSTLKIIGYGAFENCEKVVRFDLPKALTSIYNAAFWGCSAISSIDISEAVKKIEPEAFSYCAKLEKINVSEENKTFKSIDGVLYSKDGMKMFAYPMGKGGVSYTVVDGTKSIESYAFEGCKSLKEITLPVSLEEINREAFGDCQGLKTMTLPKAVKIVSMGAFSLCTNLKGIMVDPANETFRSLEGVVLTKDGKILTAYPFAKGAKYTIPEGVEKIAMMAFANCSNLDEVGFPVGLKEIQQQAFEGCASLAKIELPASLEKIGNKAFVGGKKLQSITIKSLVPPTCSNGAFDLSTKALAYLFVPENTEKAYQEKPVWASFKHIAIIGTGVAEIGQSSQARIYPNPATGIVTLEALANQTYRIFNMHGSEVLSGKVSVNGEELLDISSLTTGTYIVSIGGNTLKLIVR